ncbi:hypothetical protein [Arthrobacter sp. CAN_C5]|uniref:hypothetical protein n=1 Tax=Arthrobacter sp. CAN_C5 TaxID=2760706 RepID=UPI001AE3D8E7|nr:hypothetical protein [Arthrobacter sp. CAN_C5]MBP2216329.1 hypothetical protein [Arthrobacter sp. CAN_C5]
MKIEPEGSPSILNESTTAGNNFSALWRMKPFFDELLVQSKTENGLAIFDPELGALASCCSQSQIAHFYALHGTVSGLNNKKIADALATDIRSRQNINGSFGGPYNVPIGEEPIEDIAEIGAAADALYRVYDASGSPDAKHVLLSAAEYVLTRISAENPGAVYKNASTTQFDVLNGNAYAAIVLARAYQVTSDEKYRIQVVLILEHLIYRFGAHEAGWWAYREDWNGSLELGFSVAYQATIVGWGSFVSEILDPDLHDRWVEVLGEAAELIAREVLSGQTDLNESPTWSRDWGNVWEIYLALWRFRAKPSALAIFDRQWKTFESNISTKGMAFFQSNSPNRENRSITNSQLRKAANFAGISSSIIQGSSLNFLLPLGR